MPVDAASVLPAVSASEAKATLLEDHLAWLATDIAELGREALASPDQHHVVRWLEVYAPLAALSVEEPADVTYALAAADGATFASAPSMLSAADRARVGAALSPSASATSTEGATAGAPSMAEAETLVAGLDAFSRLGASGDPRAAAVPDLMTFRIVRAYDGDLRLWDGVLDLSGRGGEPLGSFRACTGGFIASFTAHCEPTPPGRYRVVAFDQRPRSEGLHRGTVRFAFVLHPRARDERVRALRPLRASRRQQAWDARVRRPGRGRRPPPRLLAPGARPDARWLGRPHGHLRAR